MLLYTSLVLFYNIKAVYKDYARAIISKILPVQDPRVQYLFPLQIASLDEQLHEPLFESQKFPLEGSEHEANVSEQRHSPKIVVSQKEPVFRS